MFPIIWMWVRTMVYTYPSSADVSAVCPAKLCDITEAKLCD